MVTETHCLFKETGGRSTATVMRSKPPCLLQMWLGVSCGLTTDGIKETNMNLGDVVSVYLSHSVI